jgi:leucyl/phenylalanyl-tRNA--protein transferase
VGNEKAVDLEQADEDLFSDGIVAVTRSMSVDDLYRAYTHGIFPWPYGESLIPWVSPPKRTILEFDEMKIPSSLPRFLKKQKFRFRVNVAFEDVIRACASAGRPDGQGTWITPIMIETYCAFHRLGYAVCYETLDEADRLVGGLYGVRIGNYFAGESMFYLRSGASKFALLGAIGHLRSQGLTWLDAQVMTPLLASFGAKEIARGDFMWRLKGALPLKRDPIGGLN